MFSGEIFIRNDYSELHRAIRASVIQGDVCRSSQAKWGMTMVNVCHKCTKQTRLPRSNKRYSASLVKLLVACYRSKCMANNRGGVHVTTVLEVCCLQTTRRANCIETNAAEDSDQRVETGHDVCTWSNSWSCWNLRGAQQLSDSSFQRSPSTLAANVRARDLIKQRQGSQGKKNKG